MSSSSDEDVSSPPYDESDEMSALEADGLDDVEDEEEEEEVDNLPTPDDELVAEEDDTPPPPKPGRTSGRPVKKRTLTLYNEEEDSTDGTETPPVASRRPAKRQRSEKIDADLILTDEEAEYDPHNNPDVSKMTERQRRRFLEEDKGNGANELFLELEDLDKKSKKKQETEQQTLLRKAESARRRQHLKNKQLEEEKQDTVNKLLKRRANKTRGDTNEETDLVSELRPRRPVVEHAAMNRWVSRREGEVLGIERG